MVWVWVVSPGKVNTCLHFTGDNTHGQHSFFCARWGRGKGGGCLDVLLMWGPRRSMVLTA